jgi:hypothetical protein
MPQAADRFIDRRGFFRGLHFLAVKQAKRGKNSFRPVMGQASREYNDSCKKKMEVLL